MRSINFLKPAQNTAVTLSLPEERDKNNYPVGYSQKHEDQLSTPQISIDYVLVNKVFRYIVFANAFIYLVRYGVLDRGPTYVKEARGFGVNETGWGYFVYEYGWIPHTMLCGWLIDKIFKGRRAPATGIHILLVLLAGTSYWKNYAGNSTIDNFPLITNGFLIYGPVMIICVRALDLVRKKAAGTVSGLIRLFDYLGGILFAVIAAMEYIVDTAGMERRIWCIDRRLHTFFLFRSFTWKNKNTFQIHS